MSGIRYYIGVVLLFVIFYFVESIVELPLFGAVAIASMVLFLLYNIACKIFKGTWYKPKKFVFTTLFVTAYAAVSLGTYVLNQWHIRYQVDRVIGALCEFKQDTGKFPERLDEVCPKYLPSIPKPKMIAFHSNEFRYGVYEGEHMLDWTQTIRSYGHILEQEEEICTRVITE